MRHAGAQATAMRRFWIDEHGQDLVEYGLLASLIATFVIGALGLIGDQIQGFWTLIAATNFQ